MALLLFRLGIDAPKGVSRALGLVQTLRAATQRDGLGPGFLIPRLLRFVLTNSLFCGGCCWWCLLNSRIFFCIFANDPLPSFLLYFRKLHQ